MPDYLADRLAGWFGWGSPDGTNLLGDRPGETATNSGAYATRVGPLGVAEAKRKRRTEEADEYPASGPGWGSPQQLDARTVIRPDYLKAAQTASLGPRLQAREPPAGGPGVPSPMGRPPPSQLIPPQMATPGGPMPPIEGRQALALHPMGPDVPMAAPGMAAPRSPPGAGQPMPQAGGGGQPRPLLPSGQPPPQGPNLLGRARDWLGGEAFPAGQGMSRGMVLAQALGNFGAGLSSTGRVGTGLQMANKGMWDARAGEQKRQESAEESQYRRLEMAYKQKKLEQEAAPKTHVIGAGGALVGPGGEVLYADEAAKKAATTAEAALLDPNTPPEIKAQAQRLLQQKNEPSERDRAYIASLERSGQHQKAMEEIERIRANKPAGTGSAPAPTLLEKAQKYAQSLPPGSPQRVQAEQYAQRVASSGGGAAGGTTPPPGYAAAPPAALNEAAKQVMTLDNTISKFDAFTSSFRPELQTARAGAGATIGGLMEWAGLPMDEARTAQLESVTGQKAALGEIAGIIRNDLFGAGLTGPEMKSAETFIPKQGDSATEVKTKMANLAKIARNARSRHMSVLQNQGIPIEPPSAPAEEPPAAPQATAPPAEMPALALNQSPREYARTLVRDFGFSEEQAAAKAREEMARLQGEGG